MTMSDLVQSCSAKKKLESDHSAINGWICVSEVVYFIELNNRRTYALALYYISPAIGTAVSTTFFLIKE